MKRLGVAVCLSILSVAAFAADLEISNGWIRLLPAGAPSAGYFELRNNSAAKVTLVGVTSSAFGQAMLHRTVEKDGRSSMTDVEEVAVDAGGTLVFAPGGYHVMLMRPTNALKVGDKLVLTLKFKGGEKVSAPFQVRGPTGH